MQALIHDSKHVVGGADVKLPDVLGLPRRERFRIHRFDVGIGEQAEHLQPLGRSHLLRKLPDRAGIKNIAAQVRAQFHVAIDQEKDRLAVRLVQIEAVEAGFGDFDAGGNVVVGVCGLTGIVKQQRKVQQVGLLELIEQLGISLVPSRYAIAAICADSRWPQRCAHRP